MFSLGCASLSLSFTISTSSSELVESNKKREELEKHLKESNEEKLLLLEEIAQLKQDLLTTRERGDGMLGETLRTNRGTVLRENGLLVSQSSAGSSDGRVKQVRAALPSAPCSFSPVWWQNQSKMDWKPVLCC